MGQTKPMTNAAFTTELEKQAAMNQARKLKKEVDGIPKSVKTCNYALIFMMVLQKVGLVPAQNRMGALGQLQSALSGSQESSAALRSDLAELEREEKAGGKVTTKTLEKIFKDLAHFFGEGSTSAPTGGNFGIHGNGTITTKSGKVISLFKDGKVTAEGAAFFASVNKEAGFPVFPSLLFGKGCDVSKIHFDGVQLLVLSQLQAKASAYSGTSTDPSKIFGDISNFAPLTSAKSVYDQFFNAPSGASMSLSEMLALYSNYLAGEHTPSTIAAFEGLNNYLNNYNTSTNPATTIIGKLNTALQNMGSVTQSASQTTILNIQTAGQKLSSFQSIGQSVIKSDGDMQTQFVQNQKSA